MEDPRFTPEVLRCYLLGGEWRQAKDMKGLLARTRSTVEAAWLIPSPKPPGSYGSIIGFDPDRASTKIPCSNEKCGKMLPLGKKGLPRFCPNCGYRQTWDYLTTYDNAHDPRLFDSVDALATLLSGWLGNERGEWDSESLAEYVPLLFDRTVSEIAQLLDPEYPHIAEADLYRCIDLINGLLEWSGTSCIHSFRPESPDAQGDYEASCDLCGFHFMQVGWLPQAPLARCEICESPIPQRMDGTLRKTCGAACKQKAYRDRKKENAA